MLQRNPYLLVVLGSLLFALPASSSADERSDAPADALRRAGDNRDEIQGALDRAPEEQREGMRFLVAHMPDRDLRELTAEFLLENCSWAYRAWEETPWKESVPKEIFLNDVLPYASINERRDNWRQDFHERFRPLVRDAKSPSEAGAILNQKVFPMLKVRYSTGRRRADQGPYESIETGTASCTGLSVLLIDACRSVGVPARFVGTPLWSDRSGNHSWVEIWDDGWHFTGAAEPTGDRLDQAWFVGRASTAQRDHRLHAIYAVSFKRTPLPFPMVWNRRNESVHAVNVTDRYTRDHQPLPEGRLHVMFRARDVRGGDRRAATLKILDTDGNVVFEGETKDERFDANDHLTAVLERGGEYRLVLSHDERKLETVVSPTREGELVDVYLSDTDGSNDTAEPSVEDTKSENEEPESNEAGERQDADDSADSERPGDGATALQALREYLAVERNERPALEEQPFARIALTEQQARRARELLCRDHAKRIREERADEMRERLLKDGDLRMPFFHKVFGDKPEGGRSMYISMHGGGGAPKQVNDRQWLNQQRLYEPAEGVYVAPRAATDTWNLWHQTHIDAFFDRLIENLVVFEDVNPNRVYLMGYSAGGDGVYQLAPRMADRFAAAAMMAGHPNETSPLGLRNLPFAIFVGGRDSAYKRNEVARQWGEKLGQLHEADPRGYVHLVRIYPDKGHWMDREDAEALAWMHRFDRDLFPHRVVWKQDDVRHDRFYWLAVDSSALPDRAQIVATYEGRTIELVEAPDGVAVSIRLDDRMMDLDQEIVVQAHGRTLFRGEVSRTIDVIARTLSERGDPAAVFWAEVTVTATGERKAP